MLGVKTPQTAEAVPPWSQVQVCVVPSTAPSGHSGDIQEMTAVGIHVRVKCQVSRKVENDEVDCGPFRLLEKPDKGVHRG